MTDYRRAMTPGGTWFFTVALADRKSSLLTDEIDRLRASFRNVLASHPFKTIAMVVLPEHLHAIWTLPPDDSNYAMRWRLIKAGFSRQLPRIGTLRASLVHKGERGIWQRRYWEHLVRDEDDLQRHMDYIHFNPVKHGLVRRAGDWPHSTFHRYVENGLVSSDWGIALNETGDFGERQ